MTCCPPGWPALAPPHTCPARSHANPNDRKLQEVRQLAALRASQRGTSAHILRTEQDPKSL